MTDKIPIRMKLARIIHKAIREFEVKGCPEAFSLKPHIDQIIATTGPYYIEKGRLMKRERILEILEEYNPNAEGHFRYSLEILGEVWQALREKPMNDLVEKIAKDLSKLYSAIIKGDKDWEADARDLLKANPSIIEVDTEICVYCRKKAGGAMLSMSCLMAHTDCVIKKLNELLDPDYDGTGKPIDVVIFAGLRKLVEIDTKAEFPDIRVPKLRECADEDGRLSQFVNSEYLLACDTQLDMQRAGWVKPKE